MSIILFFQGVTPEEKGYKDQQSQKWTADAKEKYIRDQSETSIRLGLIAPPETNSGNKKRHSPVQCTYLIL